MRFISNLTRCLTIVIVLYIVESIDLFDVHKNGSVFLEGKRPFFAYNRSKHLLPNRFTMIAYGNWSPQQGSPEQQTLSRSEDIDSLWVSNSPNRFVLEKVGSLIENVFVEVHPRLRGFTNTALLFRPAPFSDWIVKVAKNNSGSLDGGDGHRFRGEDEFRILYINPSIHTHVQGCKVASLSANLNLATSWLNVHLQDFTSNNPSVPFIDLVGVDPRFVWIESENRTSAQQGRIATMFALHHKHGPKLYTTNILISSDMSPRHFSLSSEPVKTLQLHNTALFKTHSPQKNWIPFSCNNEVFYVSHIWPFNVAKLSSPGNTLVAYATPVNFASHGAAAKDEWITSMGSENPWKFGPPHGSTQGVMMDNGEYLAFFHSYTGYYRDKVIQTYVIGAVTWRTVNNGTSKTAFQLSGISKTPIIPSKDRCIGKCADFYKDRWLHDTRLYGYVDYAVFPVSLILEDHYAYVMFAYQNIDNYIAKIDINSLLSTMHRFE